MNGDASGPRPVLQPAAPADATALARLQHLGYTVGAADILPPDYLASLDPSEIADGWRRRLVTPNPRTFVARAAGRIVGFAAWGPSFDPGTPPDDTGFAELSLLYVDPACWSAGIGTTLHDAALDAMRGADAHTARLWVLAGNTRAIGFYRRRGWVDDHLVNRRPEHGFEIAYQRYRLALTER